jgi:predicted nucleotidyltransferase
MKRKQNGMRKRQQGSPPRFQLWHPEVPGPLWDGSRVVDFGQIKAYCRVVAREFQPQRIILFGSYATEAATPNSDVDLVVIMPFRGNATEQMVKIRGRAEAPFPMDLLVWKPDHMNRTDSFTRAVLNEGKVLYESRRA